MCNKRNPDAALADKSDAEMAADLRQFWQEKVRFENELERRGYEVRCSAYTDGTTEVEINRVAKSVL